MASVLLLSQTGNHTTYCNSHSKIS